MFRRQFVPTSQCVTDCIAAGDPAQCTVSVAAAGAWQPCCSRNPCLCSVISAETICKCPARGPGSQRLNKGPFHRSVLDTRASRTAALSSGGAPPMATADLVSANPPKLESKKQSFCDGWPTTVHIHYIHTSRPLTVGFCSEYFEVDLKGTWWTGEVQQHRLRDHSKRSPSPETLLPVDAREKTVEGNTTVDNRPSPTPVSKMTYARRTVAVLLVSLLVLNGVASASSWTPCHKRATDQQTSKSASFPAKLKEASPESLHGLLDRFLPDKLRDGALESEHRAAAAAHPADPVLTTTTTTILEVRKRDDSNATDTSSNTTPPESSTSDTPPESETSEPPEETETSSEPPTETKTTTTTTSQTESPVPPSSSSTTPPPPTSSSEAPPPATSSTEDSTPTSTPSTSSPSSSSPSGTSSSLSEPTSSSTSTGPGTSSSTSSPQTLPSSSIPGETTLTTTTKPPSTTTRPPPSSRATTETFTSTSPDGVVVVVTRTNFVPAEGSETPAPSSTGVTPSLQNSAVRCLGVGSILAAGMAGVAMLLVAM